MKITDTNYVLPEVIATQLIGTAEGGANRPLFIRGIDIHSGSENDFVLKYRGAERMDERTSVRELVAALMADTLGICVPNPVKILVTDNFLAQLNKHPDFTNIQKSKGLNFGCTKIEPNNNIIFNQLLSFEQQQQALKIFVFDLWIQNGDRRFEKPNTFFHNENIYVIDHEVAFGFLDMFSFLRSPEPFLLNNTDVNAGKNHFFYATLHQNKHVNLDSAFHAFSIIDKIFWQRVREIIPPEWQKSSEIEPIEIHCSKIIDNLEIFKQEIWTKLLV